MRRFLLLVLTIALVVTACSSGEGADETTSVPEETPSTATADTTATTAAAETTTTPADTSTTAAHATGGDDCLVGTWVLDSNAFVEAFSAIAAEEGMADAEVRALDGDFTVQMNADGSYTGVRDEWGFSVVTSEGTVRIEINGEETGTWSADDSTISINIEEHNLTVEATGEADGEVFPLPESPVDIPQGIASDSSYTCSGDVLTVSNEGVESVLNRS